MNNIDSIILYANKFDLNLLLLIKLHDSKSSLECKSQNEMSFHVNQVNRNHWKFLNWNARRADFESTDVDF